MEIEVGEYVRTFNGLIGKVVELTDSGNYAIRIYNGAEYVVRAVIKNHSKNIIDLIEVGDYVNGYKIIAKSDDGYIEILTEDIEQGELLEEQDIKTILTKEQYMQNCYKIPEKSSGNN